MAHNDHKRITLFDLFILKLLGSSYVTGVPVRADRLDIELQESLADFLADLAEVFGGGANKYLAHRENRSCWENSFWRTSPFDSDQHGWARQFLKRDAPWAVPLDVLSKQSKALPYTLEYEQFFQILTNRDVDWTRYGTRIQ